jgi:type I restriction enzyme M protein
MGEQNNAAFIWSIANLLRGTYKQADYGKVILPFTVLRRLDSALEATKVKVIEGYKKHGDAPAADFLLQQASGYSFYNTSPYDLKRAAGDTTNLRANLTAYIEGFSPNVRDIFERYKFSAQLDELDENDLLLLVTQKFSQIDLHPETVSNVEMGLIFEELIRKFAEASNETAGEHFTPRDVVRLIVNLLFATDDEVLSKPGIVRSVYDPTAGTGGMLSVADDYIRNLNPEASLTLFGQELNAESYAIAKADMVIKGQDIDNMVWGDTLTSDGHNGKRFDYCLANPPFGVEWKKQQAFVEREHRDRGFDGRFGPGLPRVSDGSLLFLLHLVKKMRPVTKDGGGGRIGIVFNGSPLFTGNAGQGESEIRKYLLEQDLIEAVVGLPQDMFYNTGIATYIWILSNHKPAHRKGKIQLIDATSEFEKMRKGLGDKKNEISQTNLENIVIGYDKFEVNEYSKIFSPIDFGYTTVTIERPLRLTWALTPQRISNALEAKAIEKLSQDVKAVIEQSLLAESSRSSQVTTDLEAFSKRVTEALKGLKLTSSQLKSLLAGLSESDATAPPVLDKNGNLVPDVRLRDTENIPLTEDIEFYLSKNIAPYVKDFWADRSKDKVGYEIPFTRHFYKYQAPRPLAQIDSELNKLISEITVLLAEVENG